MENFDQEITGRIITSRKPSKKKLRFLRITKTALLADHPATTRRTPAPPPAIRHQARHQVEPPRQRSALAAAGTRTTPTTTGTRARNSAANRARQGHTTTGKEENHQDKHSDHDDLDHQEPGHRIEVWQLWEDHHPGSAMGITWSIDDLVNRETGLLPGISSLIDPTRGNLSAVLELADGTIFQIFSDQAGRPR